ncbi:MAG TPA: flagellar biosynthetic protein FliO [Planctomycetaceae bacterium]|nr:flagellar biosynthetic protein FliO [Planctomycetaceae bacterium]
MFRGQLPMAALVGLVIAAAAHAGDSGAYDEGYVPPPSSHSKPSIEAKKSPAMPRPRNSGGGWWTTLGGLVAVLALFFVIARLVRKSAPAAQKTLPAEVMQVLGRKSLDYRHAIHLIRFGSRLLVLGSSQEGLRTLSEIADPLEVDYLAGLCKPSEPASVAQSFNQLFKKFQSPAAPEPEAELETDLSSDSDPAVLRLQERLQPGRADPSAAIGSFQPKEVG